MGQKRLLIVYNKNYNDDADEDDDGLLLSSSLLLLLRKSLHYRAIISTAYPEKQIIIIGYAAITNFYIAAY